jgi:hypothetical protein
MARYSFGGEISQGMAVPNGPDLTTALLKVGVSVAVPLYNAEGGTIVSDFVLWDQVTQTYSITATSITSTAAGNLPKFQGPDGVQSLYTQSSDGTWLRLRANDAAGTAAGTAAATAFTAAGALAATNVQAALEELDTEKLAASAATTYVKDNVLNKMDKAALQTELGVDDTAFESRVLAILNGHSYYPDLVIGDGEPLPVTAVEGAGLDVVVGAVTSGITVAPVIGESVGGGTTGLTTTGTPAALGANAVCFAAVTAYLSGATGAAPAPRPNSFTAMGLTWTEVTIPALNTTNGLNSMKLYKGTGTGTTAKPVIGFPSAVTGCHVRIAHLANANGTVEQATSAAISSSVGTPSVSLPAAPGANSVTLTAIVQNNISNTQTPGTGFTEIGSAVSSTGMRTSGAYAIPALQTASWTTPTSPTPYQKLVAVLEVS